MLNESKYEKCILAAGTEDEQHPQEQEIKKLCVSACVEFN